VLIDCIPERVETRLAGRVSAVCFFSDRQTTRLKQYVHIYPSESNDIATKKGCSSPECFLSKKRMVDSIYDKQSPTPRKIRKPVTQLNKQQSPQKYDLITIHISHHASTCGLFIKSTSSQAFNLLSSHFTHTGSSLSPRRKYLPSSNSPPHSYRRS
jgi:hypothetical protein